MKHRYIWITGATVTGLLLAVALSVSRGGDDAGPPPSFWSLITPVGTYVNPPESLGEISNVSDAIVVAHVTGVREGREQRGFSDSTPPAPGASVARSSFVDLTVDRVVKGRASVGQTLTLETLATPPSPETYDDVRALIPTGGMLFFLHNNGTSARKAGFGKVMDPIEDSLWGLVTDKGAIAQGPSGLYEALDPNGSDLPFLQSFSASTIDEAATHIADTLH